MKKPIKFQFLKINYKKNICTIIWMCVRKMHPLNLRVLCVHPQILKFVPFSEALFISNVSTFFFLFLLQINGLWKSLLFFKVSMVFTMQNKKTQENIMIMWEKMHNFFMFAIIGKKIVTFFLSLSPHMLFPLAWCNDRHWLGKFHGDFYGENSVFFFKNFKYVRLFTDFFWIYVVKKQEFYYVLFF